MGMLLAFLLLFYTCLNLTESNFFLISPSSGHPSFSLSPSSPFISTSSVFPSQNHWPTSLDVPSVLGKFQNSKKKVKEINKKPLGTKPLVFMRSKPKANGKLKPVQKGQTHSVPSMPKLSNIGQKRKLKPKKKTKLQKKKKGNLRKRNGKVTKKKHIVKTKGGNHYLITTAIRRKGKNKKKVSKGHNKKSKLKPRKLYKNTKSQLRKQKRKPVSNNV